MRQGKPVELMQVKGVRADEAKVRGCKSEYGVEACGGLGHHAQPDPGLSWFHAKKPWEEELSEPVPPPWG